MRFAVLMFFLFLLSVSTGAYIDSSITPHTGDSSTEIKVDYTFSKFYGTGYLRFYAIKCSISDSIDCSFSKNSGKYLLKEKNNFDFSNGTEKIFLSNLDSDLYRICLKAHNHTKYAEDCDSKKYFQLKNENQIIINEPDIILVVSQITANETEAVFTISLSNPSSIEKEVLLYSFLFKTTNNTAIFLSENLTENQKIIVLPAFSSINLTLKNEIINETEFSANMKYSFDEKERSLILPISITKTRKPDILLKNFKESVNESSISLSFDAVNQGEAEGTGEIFFISPNFTKSEKIEINEKSSLFFNFKFNESPITFLFSSANYSFSKIIKNNETKKEISNQSTQQEITILTTQKLINNETKENKLNEEQISPAENQITSYTVKNTSMENLKIFALFPILALIGLYTALKVIK